MPKDYGSWLLADLKAELRKRNAKVTGKKAVLVQRLLDYDVMFGELVNDPLSTYRIHIPEPGHFFDVNSNTVVPSINEDDIKRYSLLGERQNLMTSRNMYDENYLLTSRVAQSGSIFFVTAVCAAEMKKNISYNTTVMVQKNNIMEAQCECAAGTGPYAQCKHVLVLMYGLVDFTLNKKIRTRASPTSNLQTFHQPKHFYTGEPIMAQNLRLKINNANFKKISTFDPRTSVQSKEKYVESFINLTTNFAAIQKVRKPIHELRKSADKRALDREHDYLEKTMEEVYVDSCILTNEQISELEKLTRGNNKIWKRERQRRLQSSNFGKICKSSTNGGKLAKSFLKYQSVLTPATKHGLKYEMAAIEKMSEITGVQIKTCGIFVYKEHQFLASTPDGIFGDHGVVEIKCPYSAKNKTISPESVPYLYLCNETGEYKLNENHDYYFQIQGQLLCTGRNICYFGVYTISDFYYIKIQKNEMFIKDMLEKLIQFYKDHYKYLFLCKHLYNIKV